MFFLRYVTAFSLRLFLVVPFILARSVFDVLAASCERISHALDDVVSSLRQISSAPYISHWNKQIEEMEQEKKLQNLKKLRSKHK